MYGLAKLDEFSAVSECSLMDSRGLEDGARRYNKEVL